MKSSQGEKSEFVCFKTGARQAEEKQKQQHSAARRLDSDLRSGWRHWILIHNQFHFDMVSDNCETELYTA